jgi:hypothetical protein
MAAFSFIVPLGGISFAFEGAGNAIHATLAIFVAGMYVGAALLTFGFQTHVRLDHCSGYGACAVSLAKGAVWSTIWPASWLVYTAGLQRRSEGTKNSAAP